MGNYDHISNVDQYHVCRRYFFFFRHKTLSSRSALPVSGRGRVSGPSPANFACADSSFLISCYGGLCRCRGFGRGSVFFGNRHGLRAEVEADVWGLTPRVSRYPHSQFLSPSPWLPQANYQLTMYLASADGHAALFFSSAASSFCRVHYSWPRARARATAPTSRHIRGNVSTYRVWALLCDYIQDFSGFFDICFRYGTGLGP